MVTSPSQLLLNGKLPGSISMFVWDRGGALRRYEVVVQRDLVRLSEQMKQLFPGEKIEVQANGKNIVLSGAVSSKEAIERAINVASGYVDRREEVVSLLQLQGGAPSNQVLLRVRFAEVSRSALTELGASFFTSPLGVENTLGRITTQQYPSVGYDELAWTKESSDFGADVTSATGKFTFSDFLNLFLFSEKYDLGAMIRLLSTRGLFQSLAEPNLVAESGKEASFLAGGEFPIPVAQGSGANIGVSVLFKEFGVRLNFTPTVTGDRIHLKVRPEVSTLDFANSVQLAGFRIPALTTRRTETELELANRQTFAIAGLMNNTMTQTMSKVPGFGDIPILGLLFKSKAAQKNQTELVVMITPEILPNNSRGVTPNLPRTPEPFLPPMPDNQTIEPRPPAFGDAQTGGAQRAGTVPVIAPVAITQPPATSPATAAAAVSALNPSNPRTIQPAELASAPAASSAPAAAAPAAAAPATAPQLTDQQRRALARARAQEQQRMQEQARAEQRAKAAEAKRQAEAAREQARRDREAARRAEEAKKKQAEAEKKQAAAAEERQKAIEEANAKVKAAQAAYEAELAKQSKQ
jgi:pilus assembly protein CpaC